MPTNVQIDKIALAGHAAATESSSFLESPTLFRQFRITSDITTTSGQTFIASNLEEVGGYGFKGVGTMSAASAATATITVNDPGPNAGDTILITSADGTSKTYTGHADTTTVGSREFSVAGSNTDVAQALKTCINTISAGHASKITASGSSNVITLTSDTTGTAGNRTITNAGSPLSNTVISSRFTGGRDGGEMIFPQTGIYLVSCTSNIARASADVTSLGLSILQSSNFDNSGGSATYTQIADTFGCVHTDAPRMMLHASVVMDVTDVSTTVARFRYDTNGAATIVGDTTLNKTYFQYLRVGST
jgi:hypothetical protein